jgi:hypothetical protein
MRWYYGQSMRPTWGRQGRRASIADILIITVILVAVLIGIGLLISALRGDEESFVERGVTMDAFREDPERYFGEEISLQARIDRVVGERAFVLGDNDVLVVLTGDATVDGQIEEGFAAFVQGTVHPATAEEVAAAGIDQATLDEFDGQAAMLAHTFAPAEEDVQQIERPIDAGQPIEVGEVIANPDDYIGQTETVLGTIGPSLAETAVLLRDIGTIHDDEAIILIGDVPPGAFISMVQARVTGEIVEWDADALQQRTGSEIPGQVRDWDGELAMIVEELILLPTPLDLVRSPALFLDRQVHTIGRIQEVHSDRVFILDEDILVIANGDVTPLVGAEANIRGQVVILDRENPALADVDPQVLDNWRGEVVIQAEEIELIR